MGFEKILDGIYHVGDVETKNGLDCNPYLLIDGEDVVLFDPGATIEFEQITSNIKEIIDLDKINYVVLHHQDADMCSSVPMYEALGIKFKVITSWRTMTLVQYYGIKSEYHLLEENNYLVTLKSGRELKFIQTPYLHFPGAFVTYDKKTKVLFSSDIFGAFSFNRTLYADASYMDKMLTFHEHYMPSNSVLRPVMDVLLTYDIDMIMPQHGSIINKDVKKYMTALRILECGTLLAPIKKNLKESGGYLSIFNDIYIRFSSLYDHEEVNQLFGDMESIELNDTNEITDYEGAPENVWNEIFDTVKEKKGMLWITVVEPHVRSLCATYDIHLPKAMTSLLQSAQMENKRLMEMTKSLEQTVKSVNEKLIKCSVTGLYNEIFFKSLLIEELNQEDWRDIGALVSIDIDNFSKYKLSYGSHEENSVLNNISYMLKERFGDNTVYRMDSAEFSLYLKGMDKDHVIAELDALRVNIQKSQLFLGKLTVSIGVAFQNELHLDDTTLDMTIDNYLKLSLTRLHIAKLKGNNNICFEGDESNMNSASNSVLIVDHDETNLGVIKTFVENLGIEVHLAKDGYEALEISELYNPNVIVTEINLPKMDGFILREQLLSNSKTKDIECIYLSHTKDEASVKRANELGVMHYLKKPYLLSELIGIIKRNVRGRS